MVYPTNGVASGMRRLVNNNAAQVFLCVLVGTDRLLAMRRRLCPANGLLRRILWQGRPAAVFFNVLAGSSGYWDVSRGFIRNCQIVNRIAKAPFPSLRHNWHETCR